jgi:glycosyltransferase involved in cell wall biosynthesis
MQNSKKLKVLFVSYSDGPGGAGRAAARQFKLLRESRKIQCDMVVLRASNHLEITEFPTRAFAKAMSLATSGIRKLVEISAKAEPSFPCSVAWGGTGLGNYINNRDYDLVVLHWLGSKTLSLREISKLRAAWVVTLHDMWHFSNVEHYSLTDGHSRNSPRGTSGSGLLAQQYFQLKKKAYRKSLGAIAPSGWIARQALASEVGSTWTVHTIPNPLDLHFWSPGTEDKQPGKIRLLFVAHGGASARLKGFHLLDQALALLSKRVATTSFQDRFRLDVVGGYIKREIRHGIVINHLGFENDEKLREHYRQSHLLVLPSLVDNLPQVATEAMACGTPVLAFSNSGPATFVKHGENGLLADGLSPESLAEQLLRIWSGEVDLAQLGSNAAKYAKAEWSSEKILAQLEEAYCFFIGNR